MRLTVVPTASYDQESCCSSSQFPSPNEKMVPLMIQLALHHTNSGTNGSTLLKCHVSPNFDFCNLFAAIVSLTTHLASQKYIKTLFKMSRHCPDMSRYIKTCLVIL